MQSYTFFCVYSERTSLIIAFLYKFAAMMSTNPPNNSENGEIQHSAGGSTFRFKQFEVCHSGSAMKVGTDGVLLGALASVVEGRVLDVGTGSGLIALMIAQRCHAEITGIDIDERAVAQAAANFCRSPWPDRLKAALADATCYDPPERYELIVSNPPYYEHSQTLPDAGRALARTTAMLPYEQLVAAAARLLTPEGCFQVILPYAAAEKFTYLCWLQNLNLQGQTDIRTKVSKPPKRAILTFGREARQTARRELCLIDADGQRSAAYRSLTDDFYIK